jgi:hypothetical protein
MKTMKRKSFVLMAAFIFSLILGCAEKESHEQVVYVVVGLETIRDNWVKNGSQKDFVPTNYASSSTERYFKFTNIISVDEKIYRCRFAAKSRLLHTTGTMAITDDGIILWIYDKDSRVVISPQINGIICADK